uniref:Uncharacterized protein n=1 Tax=Romanomermis culicivorax TaxID=13658 RepID=A0A915ITG5_ROMCU
MGSPEHFPIGCSCETQNIQKDQESDLCCKAKKKTRSYSFNTRSTYHREGYKAIRIAFESGHKSSNSGVSLQENAR